MLTKRARRTQTKNRNSSPVFEMAETGKHSAFLSNPSGVCVFRVLALPSGAEHGGQYINDIIYPEPAHVEQHLV